MEPQTARLDRAGRLVLPAQIRRELELREGDEVVFSSGDAPGEVRLLPRHAAVRRAQELVRQYVRSDRNLSDLLLDERRRDAARERA